MSTSTAAEKTKGTATKESKAKAKAESKDAAHKDSEDKGSGETAKSQASPASKAHGKSLSAGGKASDAAKDAVATTTPVKEGKVTKKMLKEAEQELFQLLLKKKQADRNLMDTEAAIYDFETSYFESSGSDGNIVHGFEGYLNTGRHERRQMHFTDADRIFSQSSATFKKAQEPRITTSFLDSDSDESVSSHATGAGRPRMRKGASAVDVGGSTIKHNAGANRQGTPGARATPTPAGRTTKKIKLSMDAS
ncbi:chromatin modification- protein eaf6 [Coemansia sp. RSA 1933]|nr:chromatin modification- protein eaf6 [Coemansia sp. RSA 1933]